MLTLTWITSIYFISRRCICSYVSFTASAKDSHSHTGGLYIFKGNNYILWSFCLQKMFIKRWSEICWCHCNGTSSEIVQTSKNHYFLSERLCVGGGWVWRKNGLIAFHLFLPGALCVCLLTPGSKLSSLRTKQPLLCVRPAWAHLAAGTRRFVLYFTHWWSLPSAHQYNAQILKIIEKLSLFKSIMRHTNRRVWCC